MTVETMMTRAAYAAVARAGRSRLHVEAKSLTRGEFRRDCDRLIHSTAFRRLAHKTQVFVYHEGDHFRTRLTHTLEVTQIARSIARALGLDEDLAEASALGHDLGHPPFGHAGERALDRCLAGEGGFDHNAQTLAVVTRLESHYAAFDGLNLTWDTLEGLVKHNGPLIDRTGVAVGRHADGGVAAEIRDYCRVQDLELWSHASAEAQAAAISDDIAYDAHDIDDGLRAGLFGLEDLAAVPLAGTVMREIAAAYPGVDASRRGHELIRRLITRMIEDVIAESRRRFAALDAKSVDDVRRADAPVIAFSAEMAAADTAIKAFLLPHMYRHERVMRVMRDAERVVAELFGTYSADAAALPDEWRHGLGGAQARSRYVADFIAGMTDRYALIEHARLFATTPELR
ncbi:deoxyguanosinetriphosphate triphosphohydrolase [Astrobacterium formosum]|uniref:deoxyguanosinetriphosphate triphosphohydrolase n=1 Tax=Astrobacterium formosum TaxID=3069710 RepID=UPI003F50C9AB